MHMGIHKTGQQEGGNFLLRLGDLPDPTFAHRNRAGRDSAPNRINDVSRYGVTFLVHISLDDTGFLSLSGKASRLKQENLAKGENAENPLL